MESTFNIILMFIVITIMGALMTLYLNNEYWTKRKIPTYDGTIYWFFFSMTCVFFAVLIGCFTLFMQMEIH